MVGCDVFHHGRSMIQTGLISGKRRGNQKREKNDTDRHCLWGTILIDIVYGARKQTFYDGDPE